MTLKKIDDCRYDCEIGEFYKIFAQNDRSWEFKSNGPIKEADLLAALNVLRSLNRTPRGPR